MSELPCREERIGVSELHELDGAAYISERDPDYIQRHLGMIRTYASYFSPEVRGTENIPNQGPALMVGNHSGAFYMPDTWITALAILDRRGVENATYALTYEMLLEMPVVGLFLRRIGAIRAGSDEAERALAEGALVLDYPGGDWEACRPWWERNTIDFGGRTGFIRLALRSGVPVVPVVSQGGHNSVIVVARGDRIAKLIGLDALRIKVFPIFWGPTGPTTVLFPPPPLPSSITIEVLPFIDWSGLGPEEADNPETVKRCAEQINEVMQGALDRLNTEFPHPVRQGLVNLLNGVRKNRR